VGWTACMRVVHCVMVRATGPILAALTPVACQRCTSQGQAMDTAMVLLSAAPLSAVQHDDCDRGPARHSPRRRAPAGLRAPVLQG
jgi:hypothetical protein